VNTFTYGGSETETIELVSGADPDKLRFSSIAVRLPLPLPDGEPARDGSFPLIYAPCSPWFDASDPRVHPVPDFRAAVRLVLEQSDVVITWGLADLHHWLPADVTRDIVVMSKDSGDWAKVFLHANALLTRHYVANSSSAASSFPDWARPSVRVIHNGINPRRVEPRLSAAEQRRLWGLLQSDKVAGYLGRIEEDKGVLRTVEGVARLPAEWKAVFIGVNPNCRYVHQLKWHCETLIPGRYRILGWCHDVGSALAAMDIFTHPSEHEGFSNSIAEAWLAGVPTVYTRSTGAVTDLGDLGIPVSSEADGQEIAEAIRKADGNLELIRKARQIIQSGYLIEHNVRRWEEYLFELQRAPRKLRVLLVLNERTVKTRLPRLLRWLQEIPELDPCGVVLSGDPCCLAAQAWTEAVREYRCPLFPEVTTPAALVDVVCRTRPQLVLVWDGPDLDWACRGVFRLPVVRIPSMTVNQGDARSPILAELSAVACRLGNEESADQPRHPLAGLTYTTKIDPPHWDRSSPTPKVRFAIVGGARTGSSHLVSLLDSHPDIACWGREVLLQGEAFDLSGCPDPRTFLCHYLFRVNARVVGFKLLWDAMDRFGPVIWNLLDELGVRLIHTVRRNLLDRYISLNLATLNNAFTSYYGRYEKTAFPMDPEAFVEWALWVQECDETIRSEAQARGMPRLELEYSTLCRNQDGILDYLGVPGGVLSSRLERQRTRSQPESIENYAEVKRHFAGTPWMEFFED
jgi:glycosyltransferase involved in cell wall biosynthesis